MNVLSNLNLNKNELQNAKLQNLATAPSNPAIGQIYFNTADTLFYGYDGSTWINLGQVLTGDAIVTLINACTTKIDDDNLSANVNSAVTNNHTHSNKALIDTYTQTEVNLADAVTKKHTHSGDDTGHYHSSDRNRANHTGTQTASTISDFNTTVRTNTLNQMATPTADVGMGGYKVINVATPVNGTDVANKDYVDSARAGLSVKEPVRVASTANIVIATGGLLTIDGVTLVAGDRVLLKNQTTGSENGIYIVASGAWTRATDANVSSEVKAGMCCWVNEGTVNGDSRWVLTTNDAITLGTTSLTFTKDFQASDIVAGAGLTKSGNQLDVVGTANRITVNADSIDIASTYVGQTSITTLGTITTGTWNATDIPVSAGGTGASDAPTARTNLGATGKYSIAIGNGSATSFVVNHALNSTDVIVQVRTVASPFDVVYPEIYITDANNVTISFVNVTPTSGQYKVVVIG